MTHNSRYRDPQRQVGKITNNRQFESIKQM